MYKSKKVWFFLFPGLSLILLFYLIPLFGGIRYSLLDGSYENRFVGLENYRKLWQNEIFLLGMKNTLLLSAIASPLLWMLSFLTASALCHVYPRGCFARSTLLLPYLAPASAVLLMWQLLFDYGGPLNRFLSLLGLDKLSWLSSSAMRVPILVMFLWKNLGLCSLIFLSALQSIPKAYTEAAELDGVGSLRRLFSIKLPMIMPTAYLVFIISWIHAFKIFREVYFISGAYPDSSVYTLQHYMNNVYAKLNYQMVTSAAYSFAAVVLVIFGILFMLQRHSANEINA